MHPMMMRRLAPDSGFSIAAEVQVPTPYPFPLLKDPTALAATHSPLSSHADATYAKGYSLITHHTLEML